LSSTGPRVGKTGPRAASLLGAEDGGFLLRLADEEDAVLTGEAAQMARHHRVLALAPAELHDSNAVLRHEAV
jgi:hypothetical protein